MSSHPLELIFCVIYKLTLITNDSGLLSMEKLAREPKTSGADQCFARSWCELLSLTSTL